MCKRAEVQSRQKIVQGLSWYAVRYLYICQRSVYLSGVQVKRNCPIMRNGHTKRGAVACIFVFFC